MLAILTTHPIQYQVPLWRALAARPELAFEVWYLTDHGVRRTRDVEFGRSFAWDLPMLEGYPHRFLAINADWTMNPRRPDKLKLAESLHPFFQSRGVTHLLVTGWHKFAFWQAIRQARRAGVEVWVRAESNDLRHAGPLLRRLRRQVHRWLFGLLQQFLCIGSANRRLYLNAGVPESRLHWAPYCVDNSRFRTQADQLRGEREEIRRRWRIPPDAFCLLFCGKFIDKKRPLDLIEAAQRAGGQAAGRKLHLLFVGSGALGTTLRAATDVRCDAESSPAAIASGNSANEEKPAASFAGFLNQTEISQAYVAADALVLPSDYGETWGLVVNEAMASGLPAVVSDAVGCGEDLVTPLNPRFRFPLGDTAALALAVEEVARHRPDAAILRRHIDRFDLQVTADTIVRLGGGPQTGR